MIRVKLINNKWHLSQIPNVNGALVSLDSNSGAISVLSGGYDFRISKFNRVTQANEATWFKFQALYIFCCFK